MTNIAENIINFETFNESVNVTNRLAHLPIKAGQLWLTKNYNDTNRCVLIVSYDNLAQVALTLTLYNDSLNGSKYNVTISSNNHNTNGCQVNCIRLNWTAFYKLDEMIAVVDEDCLSKVYKAVSSFTKLLPKDEAVYAEEIGKLKERISELESLNNQDDIIKDLENKIESKDENLRNKDILVKRQQSIIDNLRDRLNTAESSSIKSSRDSEKIIKSLEDQIERLKKTLEKESKPKRFKINGKVNIDTSALNEKADHERRLRLEMTAKYARAMRVIKRYETGKEVPVIEKEVDNSEELQKLMEENKKLKAQIDVLKDTILMFKN